MIWFYQRPGGHLCCEVHDTNEGDRRFELIVTYPDGASSTEQFPDSASLIRRSRELESRWTKQGWSGPYMRFI